jgi:hypothetical protein
VVGVPPLKSWTDNTKITNITTHSGTFQHADDVFGVGIDGVFLSHTLIRTRKQELIAADFVVDVGGTWDAATGRFVDSPHTNVVPRARPSHEVDGQLGVASAGLRGQPAARPMFVFRSPATVMPGGVAASAW